MNIFIAISNKIYQNRFWLSYLVAMLFILSPAIEMVICILDKAERITPLVFYPSIILLIIHPFSLFCGFLILICSFFHNGKKRDLLINQFKNHSGYLFMVGAAVWIIAASVITGLNNRAVFGDLYRNEPLSLVLSYFVVLFPICSLIEKEKKEQLALISICVSIMVAVYSTYYYHIDEIPRIINPYSVGVFLQHNHYGYYLAINILLSSGLFALSDSKNVKSGAFLSLVINTLVLSENNTFGAWIACLLALIIQIIAEFVLRHNLGKLSIIALIVFLLCTFFMGFFTDNIFSSIIQFCTDVKDVAVDPVHSDSAGTTRWGLWKLTLKWIAEKPIFGWGNEGIDDMLYKLTGSSRPHNELLQYAAFYGIPATVLYLLGLNSVCVEGCRRKNTDKPTIICLLGATAYFISSLFGNTMFYTTPLFFVFLGMGYSRDA